MPANVLLAGELTRFALEARYPSLAPQITPQQRSEFLEIAEATVKWAEGTIFADKKEASDP